MIAAMIRPPLRSSISRQLLEREHHAARRALNELVGHETQGLGPRRR